MRATVPKALWFLIVGVTSTAISARVNAACDSADNNWGLQYNYICVYNTIDCDGDACKTDECSQGLCSGGQGSEFITYCVGNEYCESVNGCLGCQV